MIASLQTTPVTPECPLCYRLTTSAAADKNKASFQNMQHDPAAVFFANF